MTSIWQSALTRLSTKMNAQTFEMYFRPVECQGVDGDRIRLKVANEFTRDVFRANWLPFVLEELRSEDTRTWQVEFEIGEVAQVQAEATGEVPGTGTPTPMIGAVAGAPAVPAATAAPATQSSPVIEATEAPRASIEGPNPLGLNPDYTFDKFVAGPSNQLAHAAARAISSPNPPNYNPLFMYGGAGLGKTHLMHAIGHEVMTHKRNARILYLSGERFTNDFIHSLRTGRMHEFQRRYREQCDVLLLDDIQFLANKDQTQEEFFHTFNALHELQRQIVLSADRAPIDIPDIAERLRTRFSMGLIADIGAPELELRVAIVRKKAADMGLDLPDEASFYIAESFKSNMRELAGALNRLLHKYTFDRTTISLDVARSTLEGIITRPSDHLSVDQVLKIVAEYYNVKAHDLKNDRKHKSIAEPRAIAMFLARKHTGKSFPDLGRDFGGKHHTTVLSAFKKVEERLKNDVTLKSELRSLENRLGR